MADVRIAALAADGFQEEECLVPRFALSTAGRTGRHRLLAEAADRDLQLFSQGRHDVDRAIDEVAADDYDGILIPGGAKSTLILSEDERVTKFVQAIAGSGKLVASICRGALLLANAGDSVLSEVQARELAVEPLVRQCGGIWEDREVVVDRNFISSRHPRDIKFFADAICEYLWGGAKQRPFNDWIAE